MYKEDILQDGFEQRTLSLKDDYEGKVIATLIRRLASETTNKAILYIHGFNDYFFQKEMAFNFNNHQFNFFALDLRKYGRSYLKHQKLNDIRNIKDYFEEILLSIEIIFKEQNKELYLFGHSTGGLLITLFAKEYTGSGLFSGLILNSPFFDFNQPVFLKKLIPLAISMGKYFPQVKVNGGFTDQYGKYLHESSEGEWDYNLEWKPNVPPKVNLGWVRAIYLGQKEMKKEFTIKEPVLVMYSKESVENYGDKNQIQTRDAILNVKDIEIISANIKGNVERISIDGGLHDLILSQESVRDEVYLIIFNWLLSHTRKKIQ